MYFYWFLIYFLLGFIFYLLGIYFIYMDYFLLVDWELININSCSIVMTLLFDWMSLMFIGSVMFISCMVIYYSGSYMISDINNLRFLFLVILFVISMCLMIISPNLISILLGWDGLGLVSYCLVIYFHNFNSYNAGMLTILINRIGDVAILMSIGIMLNNGSWYFIYYSYYLSMWSFLLMLFIILAAFTKSAQIPFSSWLPAAMAAPTPVSALVHSSTLVTAGVYLLIRFSYLFNYFDMSFFLLISVLTMFMSGLGAVFEYDMKKIIALSTLSQLGMMMSILFMGFPLVSFYHLLTHAFFKALLFLCSGLFIHCVNDIQDIRYMGGFINNLPYTSICFGISNLSLCGLPFLSGFYSKDMILELMNIYSFNSFVFFLFYFSVGLTVFYSMRLIYYCMINYVGLLTCNLYNEDYVMMNSMLFVAFMSIIKGSFLSWIIFPNPNMLLISFNLKILVLMIIIFGFLFGYFFNLMYYNFLIYVFVYNFYLEFLSFMWFMPFFNSYMIYSKGFIVSLNFIKYLEFGWGEFLFSNFLVYFNIYLSKFNFIIQNNMIKVFLCLFLLLILCLFML
uniref:NADH dehydrogenase subunit 5 n=1 Tax=Eucosmetus incisus TaxID=2676338 RepID=UPI002E7A7264|nr:NADH dehydrogenase subunit 5 [Eucosmetus incisus]WQH58281.1 NADH dehydrogenase subunit 5 [Eucosmetus incisus]